MTALAKENCIPCKKGEGKLDTKEVLALLKTLDGWQLGNLESKLEKNYKFKNFLEALAFVNRLADVAETEGHHPDITFGWGYAMIALTTHDAGGLTRNDFIVAAKIDEVAKKA